MSETLKLADETTKGRERRYKYCNYASYGLYFIGWGLGLIATMYGLKGVTDGD
jgi:hypothetical protein